VEGPVDIGTGILIIPIAVDLAEFKIIKISTLIVDAHDRAATPIGVAAAVFILQTVPQGDESQSTRGLNLGSEPNGARPFTGTPPNDPIRGSYNGHK
jgi:hypothetical protein